LPKSNTATTKDRTNMTTSNRRYFVLDCSAKLLAVDEVGYPIKLDTLEAAFALRLDLLPTFTDPDALAVLDDLGNKWIWSARGIMRFALSYACRDMVYEIVSKLPDAYDYSRYWTHNTFRGTVAGNVEQEATARLPDGPPIPVMHHGRQWGDQTTVERYADKPHWINRGPLAPMIADAPTQTHKQELTALRVKKRAAKRKEREDALVGLQMTCQACGRAIRSAYGIIALHGYERPGDGYQTASCMGAKELPFEVSNLILLAAIRYHEARISDLSEKIAGVEAETLPVTVTWNSASWDRLRNNSVSFDVTRENFEALKAEKPGVFPFYQSFENHRDTYVAKLTGYLRHWRAGLVECRKRNQDWKPTHKFVAGEWEPIAAKVAA
jgi:hypothetical protein